MQAKNTKKYLYKLEKFSNRVQQFCSNSNSRRIFERSMEILTEIMI